MNISPHETLNAAEVRRKLGVSAQTLYSYVSRGHIRALQDPQDARKSLYLKEDVERWAARKSRGRSRRSVAASVLSWGEPSLVSAITRRRGEGPVHVQLAESWGLPEPEAHIIRRVLVLCADHEMNASAFACRVTASTGACAPACLLTGLSTLSGPLHGGMAARALDFMDAAPDVGSQVPPGFGHKLYPRGDPRAAEVFRVLPLSDRWRATVSELQSRGSQPNLDFALAHVTDALGLPRDAGLILFALGRSVGWMAHAKEQKADGQVIRPRAVQRGS